MRFVVRELLQVALLALVIFFVLHLLVQTFRIDGESMEPNLHNGKFLLVNKTAYWFHKNPQRGDVIIFRAPDQPKVDRIKRVIALPGETIEIKADGTVYITPEGESVAKPLKETYLDNLASRPLPPFKVPPKQYFVLGDNRGRSFDSREWGTVPRENIIGKAWLVIWGISDWGGAPNYSLSLDG